MTIVSSKPTRPGIKPEKDICLRVLPWKICKGISKREHIWWKPPPFARVFTKVVVSARYVPFLKISLCHSNIRKKSSHQTLHLIKFEKS